MNRMEIQFDSLSPDEKLTARFEAWLAAANLSFASAEAQANYRARVKRLIDAIQLRKPDRVPVIPRVSFFPALYSGMTPEEAMYDYVRTAGLWQKFTLDFEPDAGPGTSGPGSGKALELLGYKLYKWPGHGVPADIPFQYVEAEYMQPYEYDEFINDPSLFLIKKYLGRICEKLEPLHKLPSIFTSLEIGTFCNGLAAFGDPGIQASFSSLMQAGKEAAQWAAVAAESDRKIAAQGFPAFTGGFTKAPFDAIGDTLRGMVGFAKDIYRQPGKVVQAIERLAPLMIELGTPRSGLGGSPVIMIPLHKGADGFMSDSQFRQFYWPGLKAVILGLIERGLVPCLFAEGGYNSRLEIIKDVPPGKTIWYFDQIDMEMAKKTVGKVACIMGNVPLSLLISGSQDEIRNYCCNLIDIAGKDGGFILAPRSAIDTARPENLRTMIETAKSYGQY